MDDVRVANVPMNPLEKGAGDEQCLCKYRE